MFNVNVYGDELVSLITRAVMQVIRPSNSGNLDNLSNQAISETKLGDYFMDNNRKIISWSLYQEDKVIFISVP